MPVHRARRMEEKARRWMSKEISGGAVAFLETTSEEVRV